MQRDDAAYLLDMLIAARDAVGFVSELTQQQFEQSRLFPRVLGDEAKKLVPMLRVGMHTDRPPEKCAKRNKELDQSASPRRPRERGDKILARTNIWHFDPNGLQWAAGIQSSFMLHGE